MVFTETQTEDTNPWETLSKELRADIEHKSRELQEITLLIEQSQLEVNKLAQRNAAATSRLQQVHSYFDSAPREDIRST